MTTCRSERAPWWIVVDWINRCIIGADNNFEGAKKKAEEYAEKNPGSYATIFRSVGRMSTSIMPKPRAGYEEYRE